jgi:hypothetical protein
LAASFETFLFFLSLFFMCVSLLSKCLGYYIYKKKGLSLLDFCSFF